MGFFSYLFGSAGEKYSRTEYSLSDYDIRMLVSCSRVETLNEDEKILVQRMIARRRLNDGRISLRQIDEALRALKRERRISENDHHELMQVFTEHFTKRPE